MKLIKNIQDEIKGDILSCFNRASYFINSSTPKSELIFLIFVIVIFVIILFNSVDKAGFYINTLKIILISFATFIVFCLSDTFWFLIKKAQIYKLNIRNKKNIFKLIQKPYSEIDLDNINDVRELIKNTVKFYKYGYKYHAKRNAFEIGLILLFLMFTFPTFFIFNLALFLGMFVYVFLYEQQSVNQAFEDISTILLALKKLHKKNPKQCKNFVLSSSLQEIKELKILYNAIIKIK